MGTAALFFILLALPVDPAGRRTFSTTIPESLPQSLSEDHRLAAPECVRPDQQTLDASRPRVPWVAPRGGTYEVDLTGDGATETIVFSGRGARPSGDVSDEGCFKSTAEAWGVSVWTGRGPDRRVLFRFEDRDLRVLLPGTGVWDMNRDAVPEVVLYGASDATTGCRLHVFRWDGGEMRQVGVSASGRFYDFKLMDLDDDGIAEIRVVGFQPSTADFPEVFRWNGRSYQESTDLYPEVLDGLVEVYRVASELHDGTTWQARATWGLLAAQGLLRQERFADVLAQLTRVEAALDEARRLEGALMPVELQAELSEIRAEALYGQGKFVHALEVRGAPADPGQPGPDVRFEAAALWERGNASGALEALSQARPSLDAEGYLLLQRILLDAGRQADAVAALQEYQGREPNPSRRCRMLRRADPRALPEPSPGLEDACGPARGLARRATPPRASR